MKCLGCKVDVPSTFSKAILDNVCPACGKEILSVPSFKELLRIKTLLSDSGLEEGLTTNIAAVLFQKYDLVPKGTKPTGHQTAAAHVRRSGSEDEVTDEDGAQISPEERAKIVEEMGLDHGNYAIAATIKAAGGTKELIDPKMAELFANGVYGDQDLEAPLQFAGNGLPGSDRMARAAAMKGDPSRFQVMRAE